jgi:hypothetical protein
MIPDVKLPDRLTFRATLVVVAIALGLAFAIGMLGEGTSAAMPTAKSGPRPVMSAPGAEIELSLTAAMTVPALRHPKQARKRARLRKPVRVESAAVEAAAKLAQVPVIRVPPISPTPTATPRYVAPAPQRVAPAPAPEAKPEPTATATPPASGEFDTLGEP